MESKSEMPIDPLNRVFVPREFPDKDGFLFRTHDKVRYRRDVSGVIHRVAPKVNGKEAKRARRMQRQQEQRCRP